MKESHDLSAWPAPELLRGNSSSRRALASTSRGGRGSVSRLASLAAQATGRLVSEEGREAEALRIDLAGLDARPQPGDLVFDRSALLEAALELAQVGVAHQPVNESWQMV